MTIALPKAKPLKGLAARKAQRAYLIGFAQNGIVSDGLDAAGITVAQVETWRESDPEFAALERTVVQLGDDELRRIVNGLVKGGNIDVIKAAMKRLPEYNPAKKTEVNVKGHVQHEHISKLPESELDALIMAGAKIVDAEWEEVGNGDRRQNQDQVPAVRELPDHSVRGKSADRRPERGVRPVEQGDDLPVVCAETGGNR